jgi:hypothetical protein
MEGGFEFDGGTDDEEGIAGMIGKTEEDGNGFKRELSKVDMGGAESGVVPSRADLGREGSLAAGLSFLTEKCPC